MHIIHIYQYYILRLVLEYAFYERTRVPTSVVQLKYFLTIVDK